MPISFRSVFQPVASCTMTFCASVSISYASALPEGAHLVRGAVNIAQTGGDRPAMTIQQEERIALVEWQTFNIGERASVHVVSGNPESLLINRVTGSAESRIDGALEADGAVWLINPNGYIVGNTAQIGAREFVTTAHDIDSTWLLEMSGTLHGYVPAAMRTSNLMHPRRPSDVNVSQAMQASPAAPVRTGGILPIPQHLDVPVLPTTEILAARSFAAYEDQAPSPLALPPPPSLATPVLQSPRLVDEPSGTPTISESRPPSPPPPLPPLTRSLTALNLNGDPATDRAMTDADAGDETIPPVPRSPAIRPRRLGMPSDITLPTEPFALPPSAWVRLEAGAVLANRSLFPLGYEPTHRHDVSAYHDYAPITRVPSQPFTRGPTTFNMDADRYSGSSHSDGSADSSAD